MGIERTSFGTRLRSELDRQRLSSRELARRINPRDPESARRNIARWLAPLGQAVNPSRASARLVADALGVALDELVDDEEEAADLPTLAFAAAVDALVTERVRQEIARASQTESERASSEAAA